MESRKPQSSKLPVNPQDIDANQAKKAGKNPQKKDSSANVNNYKFL